MDGTESNVWTGAVCWRMEKDEAKTWKRRNVFSIRSIWCCIPLEISLGRSTPYVLGCPHQRVTIDQPVPKSLAFFQVHILAKKHSILFIKSGENVPVKKNKFHSPTAKSWVVILMLGCASPDTNTSFNVEEKCQIMTRHVDECLGVTHYTAHHQVHTLKSAMMTM